MTLCLKLPLVPYIVCANSERPGETSWMRKLALDFAVRLYDKYLYHMGRLIFTFTMPKVCVHIAISLGFLIALGLSRKQPSARERGVSVILTVSLALYYMNRIVKLMTVFSLPKDQEYRGEPKDIPNTSLVKCT